MTLRKQWQLLVSSSGGTTKNDFQERAGFLALNARLNYAYRYKKEMLLLTDQQEHFLFTVLANQSAPDLHVRPSK